MSISPRTRHQTGLGLVSMLLACLVLAVLSGLGLQGLKRHFVQQGVQQGETQERARWEARQVQAERQAHATFAENVQLGRKAAELQLADERAARRHADQLALERRHATLTLPTPACVAPLARTTLATSPADAGAAAAVPRLTADAVRLWNSALAGRDVPAGACGADAAPNGACAADSGLTVVDAWDNQAANALSCRLDRGRLTRLIELLSRERR